MAVPKLLSNEWINSYETLTQMVVPRSSIVIAQDDEYILYNVTLFRRVSEEFTLKAREKKFIVRDFVWDAEQLVLDKKQAADAYASEREQWVFHLFFSKSFY